MGIRWTTLWRVPVFCAVAGWACFWLTVYGGFFYVVQTPGADGVTNVSVDPLRSELFSGALFLAVLLLGGLWFFRSMTKKEIAVSAGCAVLIYLAAVLWQIAHPTDYSAFNMWLVEIQQWNATVASWLYQLTDSNYFSAAASSFTPLLFIPFGKKSHLG